MKAASIPLYILVFLVSQETRALTPRFGHEPFEHVQDAGRFQNTCSTLDPYKLMAYLLAPTWPETTGGTVNLTPSPMTLSRGDISDNLYYQKPSDLPYHRAFWHPGIGPWQLDETGFAKWLGMDRFDTFVSSGSAAQEMATLYCSCADPNQCAGTVFSQWGCGSNGSTCEQIFEGLFNPNAPATPVIDEDYSTDSLGGIERRVCSIAGTSGTFSCFYVDFVRAEGTTSSWTGNTAGDPNVGLSPLAEPFYVYDYAGGGVGYEWRYWLAEDSGFPTDIRARRALGTNSRTPGNLVWNQFTASTGQGLCDHTKPHGDACLGQYRMNSATPIVVGGSTAESTVKFRALMSDPSGQASSLEVELRQLNENGGNFYGTPTQFSPMIAAGNVAEATANGLVPGYYHWQARTVNASGVQSPWQSFGGNPDGATDFSVGQGGQLQVKVTVDGSPYSGPVSYSVSGPTSFVGTNASTYPNLPEGGYTVLYLSGGPANTSYSNIVPATSQFLAIGNTISWTLAFTTNRGPFCSANSGTNAQSAPSAACGGTLSVTLAGSGSGRVVSNPSGIDCSAGTCSTSFAAGTQVALSANSGVGSIFAGWSGDAACGSGRVTVNGNVACIATFSATSTSYTLSVTETGSGTVTSSDGGISCAGGTCTKSYLAGTTVTLTASAGAGWSFSSWLGACAGAGPVVRLIMNGNMGCTANFTQNPQPAPVTTTGAATNVTATSATLNGTINPENFAATAYFEYGPDPNLGNATPGIPFGPGNNSFFPYAQTVTGLACATTYRFRAVGVGAGGDYIASNNTFMTAQCPPATCYPLNLIANGDAPAPVPSPANASGCPNGQFHAGDHIALTVVLVPGDVVTGWGGTDNDTSTATTNTVTMNFPYNRAVYVIEQHICYHLTLGFTGQGSMPVATNPVGYCPADYFPWGYEVRVNASPATGWRVGGWNGTLNDTSTDTVNFIVMPTGNQTALVQYIPLMSSLQVFKDGDGAGTIVSDLPGINCGRTCSALYPFGTTVTLTAIPAAGSSFVSWSGSCPGGVVNFPPGAICYPTFQLQLIFSDGFESGDLSAWQVYP